MTLAKQKYGESVWRGMSAAEKAAAIDAQQQDFKALRSPSRRSPGRTAQVRARSPLAPKTRPSPSSRGAAVAGSLSDMNALLGTLQATDALSDGQAAQLAALQEAVLSSMMAVEGQMDKLHAQTQAQLQRFSVEKAKLIAEKEHAIAAQLAAEEEASALRVLLSPTEPGRDTGAEALGQAQAKAENTLAALAHSQSNERQLLQQVALIREEADDAKGQCASLRTQLGSEEATAQQLRKELGILKSENEEMRLKFAARMDDMARGQDKLRSQQDSLSRLAREKASVKPNEL